jgi:hypothetical protein
MFEWVVVIALVIIIILLFFISSSSGDYYGVRERNYNEKTNEIIEQNSQIIRELERMNRITGGIR